MSFCKYPCRQNRRVEICRPEPQYAVPVESSMCLSPARQGQWAIGRAELHVLSVHNVHIVHFNLGGRKQALHEGFIHAPEGARAPPLTMMSLIMSHSAGSGGCTAPTCTSTAPRPSLGLLTAKAAGSHWPTLAWNRAAASSGSAEICQASAAIHGVGGHDAHAVTTVGLMGPSARLLRRSAAVRMASARAFSPYKRAKILSFTASSGAVDAGSALSTRATT